MTDARVKCHTSLELNLHCTCDDSLGFEPNDRLTRTSSNQRL